MNGDSKFFFRNQQNQKQGSADIKNETVLSQVIDLKGFTSSLTNEIDKIKYEYYISLDKLVTGNMLFLSAVAESKLEILSNTIVIKRLVEDGVSA